MTGERRGRSGRDAIVVLGGYGAVGRAASEALAGWFPCRVVVAGRDGSKANGVADALPGGVRAAQVDATRPDDVQRALDGARLVVMCVEQANAAVAQACLERGVHYVDVSATTSILAAIAELDALAAARGATAVLSVGLAPGVTNLLARLCRQRLPTATRIDLTVLVGLGGDHGAGSRRWVLDGLTASPAGDSGRPARVRLPGRGPRTAHPFPFSDQDILSAAFGIPVATRLCFDQAGVTAAVFALRRARVLPLLGRLGLAGRLEPLLARFRSGDDRFVLHARATDDHGGQVSATVEGRQECRATGVVAAHVARILDEGTALAGVHHIDELVDPEPFLQRLDRDGIAHGPAVGADAGPTP